MCVSTTRRYTNPRLFIYCEIVHEYTIKKKKEKVKLSSTQKNQSCNQLPDLTLGCVMRMKYG